MVELNVLEIMIPDKQKQDFSEIEDSRDFFLIMSEIVKLAAANAIAEARAAGLPITFLRDNKIIRSYPDGTEEVIEGSLSERERYYTPCQPGTIYKPRKK